MKVEFSSLAAINLENILDYLAFRLPNKSRSKFLDRLDKTVKRIEQNPLLYPESKIQKGLRKCVISKYTTLYYEVQADRIYVLTIFDSRQNPTGIKQSLSGRR